jgi:hypothetical protein
VETDAAAERQGRKGSRFCGAKTLILDRILLSLSISVQLRQLCR